MNPKATHCKECGSKNIVSFPGIWGNVSKWVRNTVICRNCLDVSAATVKEVDE